MARGLLRAVPPQLSTLNPQPTGASGGWGYAPQARAKGQGPWTPLVFQLRALRPGRPPVHRVLRPDRPSVHPDPRANRSAGLFRSQAPSTDRRRMAAPSDSAARRADPAHPPPARSPFHSPRGTSAPWASQEPSPSTDPSRNKAVACQMRSAQYTNRWFVE